MQSPLPHMRTLSRFLCSAYALAFLSQGALGQNTAQGITSQSTQLQLSVIVVPAIHFGNRDRDRERDRRVNELAVSYNLPASSDKVSVTEDLRPMLIESKYKAARKEQVRVTTIVAR